VSFSQWRVDQSQTFSAPKKLLVSPERIKMCEQKITKLELTMLDRYLLLVNLLELARSHGQFNSYP